MKTKHIVKSLWIDSVMGDLQAMCLQSFLNMGVGVHLYTYNEVQNVPVGVIVCDANLIIEFSSVFRDIKGSYATFSDWFRIKLLHDVGGWWVDCDVLCLRPFDFKQPYVFATEAFESNGKRNICICNAVIKMPKGSILGKKVLEDIDHRISLGNTDKIHWTAIGARVLAKHIIALNLSKYVFIPEVFCPNDPMKYKELTEVEGLSFGSSTYAVHLWNKMWEWNNRLPLSQLNYNSFLGRMKTKIQGEDFVLQSNSQIFSKIYEHNHWGGLKGEFYSEPGSHSPLIAGYVKTVVTYILSNNIKSIVEIGCGDFNVARLVLHSLDNAKHEYSYIGYEVVKDLVDRNNGLFGTSSIKFEFKDACTEQIAHGDLLIVRQVLQHLSNESIMQIVEKFKNFKYILVSEHQADERYGKYIIPNRDKQTSAGIRLNFRSGVYLEHPPFNCKISRPIYSMNVNTGEIISSVNTYLISNP